jgi:hypothetical protein
MYDEYCIGKPKELHSITGALYYLTGFTKPFKGSSTKSGNNPKAIKARRKKNKNKKTHRK